MPYRTKRLVPMEGVQAVNFTDCMDDIDFILPDTMSLNPFEISDTTVAIDATSHAALDDSEHAYVVVDDEFPRCNALDEISPNVTMFLGVDDGEVFQGDSLDVHSEEYNLVVPDNDSTAERFSAIAALPVQVPVNLREEVVGGTVHVHAPEVTEPVYKRPRRAAAIVAEGRVREVLEWEKCKESSQKFRTIASHMNEEFDRVARGEVSYRKRTSNKCSIKSKNGDMALVGSSSSAYTFVSSDDEGNADVDDHDDDDPDIDNDDDAGSMSSFVVDDSCEIETEEKTTDSLESGDDEVSDDDNASSEADSGDDSEVESEVVSDEDP